MYNDIYEYLFVTTPIKPADLLIVFGTTYGFDEYVEGILKLYNEGYVKTILLTGGKDSTNSYKAESEMMLDCLKSFNLKCDILIEDKSVNTGENLAFSIPILQKHFGKIENIKSIIGLGKDFVARRFLMTMAKYFPTAEKMFYPINVFHCDKSNWYNNNVLYFATLLLQPCNGIGSGFFVLPFIIPDIERYLFIFDVICSCSC